MKSWLVSWGSTVLTTTEWGLRGRPRTGMASTSVDGMGSVRPVGRRLLRSLTNSTIFAGSSPVVTGYGWPLVGFLGGLFDWRVIRGRVLLEVPNRSDVTSRRHEVKEVSWLLLWLQKTSVYGSEEWVEVLWQRLLSSLQVTDAYVPRRDPSTKVSLTCVTLYFKHWISPYVSHKFRFGS